VFIGETSYHPAKQFVSIREAKRIRG
jgi:hypothetical protein